MFEQCVRLTLRRKDNHKDTLSQIARQQDSAPGICQGHPVFHQQKGFAKEVRTVTSPRRRGNGFCVGRKLEKTDRIDRSMRGEKKASTSRAEIKEKP